MLKNIKQFLTGSFIYIFYKYYTYIANIFPRFCKYFKRDVWSKDRILDTSMFLK